jgi:hypothetical protein
VLDDRESVEGGNVAEPCRACLRIDVARKADADTGKLSCPSGMLKRPGRLEVAVQEARRAVSGIARHRTFREHLSGGGNNTDLGRASADIDPECWKRLRHDNPYPIL